MVNKAELGGAQKYVVNIAIAAKKYYNVYVGSAPSGWLKDVCLKKNISYLEINNFRIKSLKKQDIIDALLDLKAFIELVAIIKSKKFTIVHTNSTKAGFIGRFAAKIAGVPIIIHTIHGANLLEDLPKYKWYILYLAEKLVAKFTSLFIAVCNNDKKIYSNLRITRYSNIKVVHNGASINICNDISEISTPNKLLNNLFEFKILTIANFSYNKGLHILLEAAKLVLKENQKIGFFIIGHGTKMQRDSLKEKIKYLGISNNIILIGFSEDIYSYLYNSDLFVLSSVKEGCPFSILEAMSASLPIVATNVGGIPEILNHGEYGLLVKRKDSNELAQTIIYAIKNRIQIKKIAEKAKMIQINLYSEERMLTKTLEIYKSLIDSLNY
ncbi:MAG: glycosyltransferase [Candidatus Helarchaeota archaeon]